MPAIVASGLRKTYGAATALDSVDLVVGDGEVHGLLGPNGAGKTTLLRILFGLVRPDGGQVKLLDRLQHVPDVVSLDGVAGFVEDPTFYPHLTAQANLEILALLDSGSAPERIPELLDFVGLLDRRHDRVGAFSTGMRQRLGLAAALLRRPRLLLLDEPTAGLDPAGIRDVGSMLRDLSADGVSVLVSSHQIGEVESVCDSFTILRRGVAVWSGGVEDLRAQASGSGYRISTSDDDRMLELATSHLGVQATRNERGDVVLFADEAPLDGLVLALARADVALRRLELLVSPLESMFFALTRDDEVETMTVQDLADHPLLAAP